MLERNEAAMTMNMLLYSMTELSTWDRGLRELVDRSYRPWDDGDRRPSHKDRRNFLRRGIWAKELNAAMEWNFMPTKIATLLKNLMQFAA
jgi:hypothetical protein